jgi:hypothetical protein
MSTTQIENISDIEEPEVIQNSENSYCKISFGTFTLLVNKPEDNS